MSTLCGSTLAAVAISAARSLLCLREPWIRSDTLVLRDLDCPMIF
jgi:hypothetical protein